jgi:hypothetical protein
MSCEPSAKAPDGPELSRWLADYDDALAAGAAGALELNALLTAFVSVCQTSARGGIRDARM